MFDEQDHSLGVAALLHAPRQGSGRRGLNNHTFTASSSSTMTMPQNIFTNPAIQPSSVINLSNSTDVVIGPMTQYQGPVSIYYMDASMQTAAVANHCYTSSSNKQQITSPLSLSRLVAWSLGRLVYRVMKLLLKVHGERTARNRRTPERNYNASPGPRINSSNTPSGSNSSHNNNNNKTDHDNDNARKSKRLTRNTLLLSLLVLLVLITAIVIVFVELNRTHFGALASSSSSSKSIYFGNTYEDGTFPNLGNGHLVIERVQWGSSEHAQLLSVPLERPIPYVLITHIGVQSMPCTNLYRCSIKMRTIQDSAIAEKNLPDIQSNFYVSDEGNIYVGRGWDWANTYANHTLAITFMGDYGRYTPTAKQLEGVQFLLAHAVANHKLDFNYKLVAQNQTKTSKSPGVNVYREIMRWRHFHPCNMKQEPKCGSELGMTADSWNGAQ